MRGEAEENKTSAKVVYIEGKKKRSVVAFNSGLGSRFLIFFSLPL